MDWLTANLKWLLAVGIIGIPTLIEITPIKLNPWSFFSKSIKTFLYGDILIQIEQTNAKLDGHIEKNELDGIKSCRLRILRFNDELIRKIGHTKEHFDEILNDISTYEKYCTEHTEYENAKAELSIENIKRVYLRCEETNGFL